MKRYETRQVSREVAVGSVCDGCGRTEESGAMGRLIEVVISVHEGEEGGRRDEYDYCDDCVVERADLLVAAGSRAPYVTGEDLPDEEDD